MQDTFNSNLEVIDNFIVHRLIAESEWGFVYEVSPRNLDRRYALKLSKLGEAEVRLFRERDILSKLGNHPNVTEVYFTGEHQGRPYIVEELAECSLRDYLKHDSKNYNKDTLANKVDILKQIISALGFAHKNGIVHRDLKPENILLTKKKNGFKATICDFGLADQVTPEGLESSLEDATSAAGTVQYLSPEQRHGEQVDQRSDLFTVGLIFYEMLTGRKPSVGLTAATEVNSSLPRWIDDFIHQCLRTNKKDRFQNAQQLLDAIELSTRPPKENPPDSPTLNARLKDKVGNAFDGLGSLAGHLVKSPLYVVFMPFFLYDLLEAKDRKRHGYHQNDGFHALLCIFLGLIYYFVGVPYGMDWNFQRLVRNNAPTGTIVYYNQGDRASESRGFYFVEASQLPEKQSFFISTPEITAKDFTPIFTLNPEGTHLYYTTPNGLVRVDLNRMNESADARTQVITSEVFNYFTQLGFIDGKLYARLKDETWLISENGELQPTRVMLSDVERVTTNGDYALDRSVFGRLHLEANSLLPGSVDIGESSTLYLWQKN
jgi:serine/threonine protein kinase